MGSNQKGGARSRKGIERKQLESFLLQWLFHRTVIELSRKKGGGGGVPDRFQSYCCNNILRLQNEVYKRGGGFIHN